MPIGKANNYSSAEMRMHAEGRASELDKLRIKILTAALASCTRQEFEERLKAVGVTMPRNTEKTVSFRYNVTKKGTVRGSTLGDYYRAEYIDELLAYNREQSYTPRSKQRQTVFNRGDMHRIADSYDDKLAKERGVFRFTEDREEYRYRRSEPFGIWVSRKEFYQASPNALVLLYAVACVLLSKPQDPVFHVREGQEIIEGVVFRNGRLYFGDISAKTDSRLQRMADALSAATKARLEYGCENRKDLDRLHSDLMSRQEELAAELRKERRIETALKNKLSRKKTLLQTAEKVFNFEGTPVELKKGKRLLYRNGLREWDFYDFQTTARLRHNVYDAEDVLEAQAEKVKKLFYENKNLKKEISELSKALDTFDRINEPGFYYGEEFSDKTYLERDREEIEFDGATALESLLKQAERRAGTPRDRNARNRTKDFYNKE